MINSAVVSAALLVQLQESAGIVSSWPNITIERSEYINESSSRTPWVGVYRQAKNYSPRTLGRHSKTWEGEVNVMVIVQHASFASGADAEDKLEELLQDVEKAIVDDTTIGGTLEILTGLVVNYSYRIADGTNNVYFQQATIEITGRVATG